MLVPVLQLAAAIALAFTALLARQNARPILCIPILVLGLRSFNGVQTVTQNLHHASVLGLFILMWLSYICNVLLVERYRILGGTRRRRWHRAYKMLFNGRWLGTAMVAPGVQMSKKAKARTSLNRSLRRILTRNVLANQAASEDTSRSLAVGNHLDFLIERAFTCLVLLVLNYLYEQQILLTPRAALYNPLTVDDFSPLHSTYLRRLFLPSAFPGEITARETIIRVLLVNHFIWTVWSTFTFLHSALSLVFVGVLRVDEPEDWPPLYGSITQSYSIRGFWGGFWHRLVYRTYTSYAKLLLKCLAVPVGSRTGKAVIVVVVFLFSGLMHAAVERNTGLCGYVDTVTWFVLNSMAILFEDCVVRYTRKALGSASQLTVFKVVGYLWTWGFMFWSLPKGQYTKIWCHSAIHE